jgi:hypothetical protein
MGLETDSTAARVQEIAEHLTYERAGEVSEAQANEAVEFAGQLREAVLGWLRREHPELI